MKVKPLDKRDEYEVKTTMSKMIKIAKQGIDYYIFAMKVQDIKEPITATFNEEKITILDKDYCYIQILPIDKNYSLTITYDEKGKIVQWYFDITASNFLDDRGLPFYEDLYLDIAVTSKKEIFLLDEDELLKAYESKDISKEQYDFAIREADLIKLKIKDNFEHLNKISRKYFQLFFAKKVKEKEDKRNTYRTNIKAGLKVAIVLKKDQKTGILTEGIVKDILTNSAVHHRGIKVRLEDGSVGRVQKILD